MKFFKSVTSNFLQKKGNIISRIKSIFDVNSSLDCIEELTDLMLMADVGAETTDKIIDLLKTKSGKKDFLSLKQSLFDILTFILIDSEVNLDINVASKPFVLLVCGVNGVGKTTTVVKIANLYKNIGKEVLVVAADTYRAAAIEQLTILCEKNFISLIKQHHGADSASVVYDSFILSKKKSVDLLIIDTSGRLHNDLYLMNDLSKIKNVLKKIDLSSPHEVLMVIDSNYGQNAVNQFNSFNKIIGISGLCFTKFDGTSKGGIILNLASTIKIPIRYMCFGENINDIEVFNVRRFLKKML